MHKRTVGFLPSTPAHRDAVMLGGERSGVHAHGAAKTAVRKDPLGAQDHFVDARHDREDGGRGDDRHFALIVLGQQFCQRFARVILGFHHNQMEPSRLGSVLKKEGRFALSLLQIIPPPET